MRREMELKVKPFADESLYSVLFRIADKYRFTHLAAMFSRGRGNNESTKLYDKSFNYYKEGTFGAKLYEQGRSFGVNVNAHVLNQFDPMLFQKEGTLFQRKQMYSRSTAKYCTHCMREQYYHRLIWDINIVTVCTEHRCFLIDSCPACGSTFTLSKLMMRYCNCGYHFLDATINCDLSDIALTSQRCIQDFLLGRMMQMKIDDESIIDSIDYFHLLNLIGRLLDSFSSEHLIFKGVKAKTSTKINYLVRDASIQRDVHMYSLLCVAVHRLIFEPKSYFADVLQTIQKMSFGKIGYRYKRSDLRELLGFPKIKSYLNVYEELLADAHNQYVSKYDMNFGLEDRRFISMSRARGILEVKMKGIERLVQSGILSAINTGKTMMISRESIEKWQAYRKRLLNVFQAADMLGLKPHNIRDLLNRQLLKPFSGPNIDGTAHWLFESKTLLCFFNEIVKTTKEVEG